MLHRLNSAATLIQRTTTEAPRGYMYYIGLDVHKKTISYCVKDVSGRIQLGGIRCALSILEVMTCTLSKRARDTRAST